jgi:formylmethanofuran dehydrogenase subunit E
MGLLGGELLGLDVPQTGKRLLTFVETDGCAADGISVATGCTVGRRTLRVMDYGKVAATFVDTETEQAIRVVPHPDSRAWAVHYAPQAQSPWHAQLQAYQVMPAEELLRVQSVDLCVSIEAILSLPNHRTTCEICGEEIINEREVIRQNTILCRACAGDSYYRIPSC